MSRREENLRHPSCRSQRRVPPDATQPVYTQMPASSGQSLVEFALVLPILVIILLGILDMSRVFTSMMTVESAAREAADYASWQSTNWQGDPTDPTSNRYKTEAGLRARACTASRNLVGFAGDTVGCTNPSISFDILDEKGLSALAPDGTATSDCDQASRTNGTNDLGPCRVQVDLTYTFDLIAPVGFDLFGTRIGLPQQLTFTRTSIFAMSDFSIDS